MNEGEDSKGNGFVSFYHQWKTVLEDIKKLPFHAKEESKLEELIDSLKNPFSLAVLGRIKTGKSTLINALIGRNLSLIGIKETTALINRICIGKKSGCFTVYWEDREPKMDCPIEELSKWNNETFGIKDGKGQKPAPKFLELYADTGEFLNYHIIDTPGTGSIFANRDEIARNFIREHGANAMIYVLSHSGHDSDRKNLVDYRAYMQEFGITSRDHCIAVLQKWDEVFWNQNSRSEIDVVRADIEKELGNIVYRVIPVIAPLGLIAHEKNQGGGKMKSEFWAPCMEVLEQYSSVETLCADLLYSDKWDKVSDRHHTLRQKAEKEGVPWNCFRLLLRELKKQGIKAGQEEEARAYIWTLSGVGELKDAIDERFSKNAELLRKAQVCAWADEILNKISRAIEKRSERQQEILDSIKLLKRVSYGEKSSQAYKLSVKVLMDYESELKQEIEENTAALKNMSANTERLVSEHFELSRKLRASQSMSESQPFYQKLTELMKPMKQVDNETIIRHLNMKLNPPEGLDAESVKIPKGDCNILLCLLTTLSTNPDARVRETASYLKNLITHS